MKDAPHDPRAPRAPIAITMGDACGIGPEIIARLFRRAQPSDCFVLGDVGVMRRAVQLVGGGLVVADIDAAQAVAEVPANTLPVLQVQALPADLLSVPWGTSSASAWASMAASISARLAVTPLTSRRTSSRPSICKPFGP